VLGLISAVASVTACRYGRVEKKTYRAIPRIRARGGVFRNRIMDMGRAVMKAGASRPWGII